MGFCTILYKKSDLYFIFVLMNKNNLRSSLHIQKLQITVYAVFGKHIATASDCERLADILHSNKQKNKISSQTLRRFFGLVSSTSKPSRFTLDVLAVYCGFRDFADFIKVSENHDLESFFSDNDESKDYWHKSEELCREIQKSNDMLVSTHHRLMKFPMARKFFLEHHPMRDMLGTVYSQYFLAYLKFNTTAEAKIFAYGFLFKSAFLQENEELMNLYFEKITKIQLSESVHVIPAALKFGVVLLYQDFISDEKGFKKTFSEMKKWRKIYIDASEKSVCSFEYTVLELLIFTDKVKEIQFLIENQTFQKSADQSFVPKDRKQTHDEVWKILCAVGFQKLGRIKDLQKLILEIDLEKLGIGWKKYYSIIYYLVQLKESNTPEQDALIFNIKNLIYQTHFFFFERQLKEILSSNDNPTIENK